MVTYELDEEQRIRTRHALLKDEADLKRLKKSNAEEGLDVGDIERKLHTLRGEADGKPGLIQIFSSQTELFDEQKAKKAPADPRQMSLDDAIEEGKESFDKGGKWADWVPKPRPAPGDRVLGIDGIERLVITDVLGFIQPDMQQNPPEDGAEVLGQFAVMAVAEGLAQGFTADDKRPIHVVLSSAGGDIDWQQVTSPPVDVDAIKEAARAGEIVDDQSTFTQVDGGAAIEKAVPRRRGRPRAAAGNLAGAVSKTVARATGDRKHPPGKGGSKKK